MAQYYAAGCTECLTGCLGEYRAFVGLLGESLSATDGMASSEWVCDFDEGAVFSPIWQVKFTVFPGKHSTNISTPSMSDLDAFSELVHYHVLAFPIRTSGGRTLRIRHRICG